MGYGRDKNTKYNKGNFGNNLLYDSSWKQESAGKLQINTVNLQNWDE